MRFIIVTSLFAALAAANSANNDFNNPAGGYSFTAGKSTTLTWDHLTGDTISLRLQSGSVTTATSGIAIASNIDNSGTFTWKVPTDLVEDQKYTVEIINDSDTTDYNFLPYFTVSGATGAASTSTAAPTTTTSAEGTTTTEESTSAEATTTTEATSSSAASSTATTMTKTTSSSTAASTTTASSAASTTATSSSSSSPSASASSSVPDTNAGVVNRVSGGMLALVAGAIALL